MPRVYPSESLSDMLPDFSGRRIIHDRFQLLDLLGCGAYGKVYKAYDRRSATMHSPAKVYAVKCMLRATHRSRQEVFQKREIALHERVSDHPNIVGVQRVFSYSQFLFVVMDLSEGGDLYTAISDKIFVGNDALIRSISLQLVDAIHFCHTRGVYHRDLKPENILMSRDGTRVFVTDFGLATDQSASSEFGCGSSIYMSPECINHDIKASRYDSAACDVWSLGIIFANMITGHNPWTFATTEDQCFATFVNDRSYLRSVLPISAETNAFLVKMLEPIWLERITLPSLRNKIARVNTFFMSEAELITASWPCRMKAADYGPVRGHCHGPVILEGSQTPELPADGHYEHCLDSPPVHIEVHSVPKRMPSLMPSPAPRPAPVDELDISDASSSDSDSDDDDDSDGPITPETSPDTCPQDPDVDIPDIEADLGEPLIPKFAELGIATKYTKQPQGTSPFTKAHRRTPVPSQTDGKQSHPKQWLRRVTRRLHPIPAL